MKRLLAAALALAVTAPAAFAQDLRNDDWTFNFFNDSSYTVRSFKTVSRNGQWSRNWLSHQLASGTGKTLYFYDPNDERCDVPVEVVFSDNSVYTETVNFCGTAIVRVDDSWISWE